MQNKLVIRPGSWRVIGVALMVVSAVILSHLSTKRDRKPLLDLEEHASVKDVHALITSLHTTDWQTRDVAMGTLIKILSSLENNQTLDPHIDTLLRMTDHERMGVRTSAMRVLANIFPRVKDHEQQTAIIKIIGDAVKNTNGYVRATAVRASGTIGNSVNDEDMQIFLINSLLTALDDDIRRVRRSAVVVLGDLAPLINNTVIHQQIITPLMDVLKDPEPYVRMQGAAALGRLARATDDNINRQQIRKALTPMLDDPDTRVRISANSIIDSF